VFGLADDVAGTHDRTGLVEWAGSGGEDEPGRLMCYRGVGVGRAVGECGRWISSTGQEIVSAPGSQASRSTSYRFADDYGVDRASHHAIPGKVAGLQRPTPHSDARQRAGHNFARQVSQPGIQTGEVMTRAVVGINPRSSAYNPSALEHCSGAPKADCATKAGSGCCRTCWA
jgi:hypothetical protein